MKCLDQLRASTLATLALLTVFVAAAVVSPYLPHTILHAQSVGPGGVPGRSSGGAVSSVFGRTGAVTAANGDYAAAQVTNAAATNATQTFTGSNTFAGALVMSGANPFLELSDTNTSTIDYIQNNLDNTVIGSLSGGQSIGFYGQSTATMPYVMTLGWSTGSGVVSDGFDTGLSRVSAGVVAVGTGAQGNASGTVEASNYSFGATPGFTGTKTAGLCVFTIQGGVITNVSGC
jgi:hypothetical protein